MTCQKHGFTVTERFSSLCAGSNLAEVLQRLRVLCKELIRMSHRCSLLNLTSMWEEKASNNTLDCISTKAAQ